MPDVGRALVTGAAGFLGAHLARSLVDDGWQVSALLRTEGTGSRLDSLKDRIDVLFADITDYPTVLKAFKQAQPHIVYHLAGDTSVRRFDGSWDVIDRAIEINFRGTLNIVRAAGESGAPVRSVVRAGGLEEYGTGPTPGDERQREQPSSPYSASQTAAAHWCQMIQAHVPFTITTLRPALVYGPGQGTDFLIPALICSLLRNQPFAMSEGMQIRDYIYVEDVVRAFRLAGDVDPPLHGRIINISSANEYRIADVAMAVARQLGRAELLITGGLEQRSGDLPNVSGYNALAQQLLGWCPQVGLEDGLARTIAWFRQGIAEGTLA